MTPRKEPVEEPLKERKVREWDETDTTGAQPAAVGVVHDTAMLALLGSPARAEVDLQ